MCYIVTSVNNKNAMKNCTVAPKTNGSVQAIMFQLGVNKGKSKPRLAYLFDFILFHVIF